MKLYLFRSVILGEFESFRNYISFSFILACTTGALWPKRGNRGIMRKARDEGRRKIKSLLPVYFSGSSAHLRPQVLADGGDVKRTNQNKIH